MIVINNKLAQEAYDNAIASKRVTSNSTPHAFLIQALIHLNFVFDVKKDRWQFIPRDASLDKWDNVEIVAADAINWLIAFLRRLDCEDIEQLLKDVAEYRTRYPDYPSGAWPHPKDPR